MNDEVNVDVDASLIPLQAGSGGLPQPVFTPPPGTTFVGALNAQTGNVVLGGGTTGFTLPSGAGVVTLTGPLTTKGDLYAFSTVGTRLAAAANDARLTTDSTQATGLVWIAASTGWGAASGTLSRAAYASYAGQTVSVAYVAAEAQATDDAVKLLSKTVAALITDLTAQKVIKP